MLNEKLYRLNDVYDSIDSMQTRLELSMEHLQICKSEPVSWVVSNRYIDKRIGNIENKKRAIERIKQIAKTELLRLIEELE